MIRLTLFAALLLAGPVAGQSVRVISDRVLSGDAAQALDVRWATADSVYVASYFSGVLQLNVASGESSRVALATPGRNCPSCSRLGVSTRYLVTSFPAYHLAWKEWSKPQVHHYTFDAVVDLDVHDQRLLMLASRTEGKRWAPDGAIAWLGSLDQELKDLRPILFSREGPKAMTIARCGFLEPGAARFFSDGSFVIVPGVEPDAYLFDETGKLVHTWQTSTLGFFDRCTLPESQVLAFSADPEQRARWRAGRTMIDDVLPSPYGPALLLHEYRNGIARWTMLVLRRNGAPQKIVLPLTSQSDVSTLRADIRGNRIAFLIRTSGQWRKNAKPASSRLVIAELQ